jgi:hypothetical protein
MSAMMLGVDPLRVDTVQQFPLGLVAEDPRAGDFTDSKVKYVKANGSITAGNAVQIDVSVAAADRDGTVINTSAADQPIEGIALVTLTTGQFGWIQIAGRAKDANCATTIVAGAILLPTATAGQLDDTAITTATQAAALAAGRAIRALTVSASNKADVLIQH